MSEDQQPTAATASKGAKGRASSAEALGAKSRASSAEAPEGAKAGYKKTKLGWLPEEWEVSKLGPLSVKVGSGVTPRGGEKVYSKEGVPFVRSQNVGWGQLLLDGIAYVTPELHSEMGTTELQENDILLNISGASIGRCAMVTNGLAGGNVNQHVCIIRPERSMLENLYLMHFLLSHSGQQQIQSFQAGGNREGLNYDQIRSFLIPQPPLPEQRRIAAILGAWDRAIATVQQLLAAQQKRKRGLMRELLSGKRRFEGFEGEWRTVRLGDLGETYTGLTGKTATDFGEGAPYIPYLNIFNNSRIDPRQVDRVRVGTNDRQNRVRRGDIFFTVSSETPDEVGMAAVLLDEVEEMYLNSFCFGFRLNTFDQLLPEFARYYLRGTTFRRALNKLAQGATRYNLSKGQLVNLHLHLPGIKEQQAIADCLESIDREIDALNRYTTRLIAQKRGLMQQLLTGRVRVKTEA